MDQFQYKEILFGLLVAIPLVLLFMYVLYWKKKSRKEIGDEELVQALTRDYSSKKYTLKFILQVAAILLCIVGAANLRQPEISASGKRAGIDVMIALDVSNSMLAEDIKPSRLERAKQLLSTLINQLEDNRVGLVLFAGKAYLQMPLTSDVAAAKMYISNASPAAVPSQGTVIGDALKLCNASLDNKSRKYKSIILISDGEGHDEAAADAIKEVTESGVVVHTVGIGSPEGAPIFDRTINDFKKDENGNTVVSKLNQKELQDISTPTGGNYYLFTTVKEVASNLVGSLNQMEKKQIGTGGQREYANFFQWFLAAALILLLLEILIPERKTMRAI